MPEQTLLIGMGIATALAVAALVAGLWLAGRRRRLDPVAARWRLLSAIGYTPTEDSLWRRPPRGSTAARRWTMPMDRTEVLFTELPDGGSRWAVGLHQYDTLTIHLEERTEPPGDPHGLPFTSGIGAIDDRFRLSSDTPRASIALVHDPKVVRALLDMPWLSLSIHGDQLVIQDRQGRSRQKLHPRGGPGPAWAAAEREVHQRALALILVILGFFHAYDRDLER